MVVKHLNQVELSRRWSLSPRTLSGGAGCAKGPIF